MSCPSYAEIGNDGNCYASCLTGWSPLDNGPLCAKNCPAGYFQSGTTPDAQLTCVKPAFQREVKPQLICPSGADRLYDKCLLDCPLGTKKKYSLCMPDCPPNFVTSKDGLSCQAEFIKRVATVREACYSSETRIAGRICLAPCDVGTLPFADNSELCYATVPSNLTQYFWTGSPTFQQNIGPQVAKVVFSRTSIPAVCGPYFDTINGQCYAKCPTGSSELGTECVADCPANFPNVDNKSACIRPTLPRDRIVPLTERIWNVLKYILIAIGLLLLTGLLFRAFFHKKG